MRLLTLLSKIDKIVEKHFIAAFWRDLANFIKKATQKAQKITAGILYGFRAFLGKTDKGIKEISRHYAKINQQWDEITISKVVPETEVPREIALRISPDEELDITDELEMKLANT